MLNTIVITLKVATWVISLISFTLLPCPPLLLELLLCRPCALSRRLSLALRLLDTATFALASLAESTLELPSSLPHLLARVLRADGGPDEGDGDGEGDGISDNTLESSVNVNFAGNYNICMELILIKIKDYKKQTFPPRSVSVSPFSTSLCVSLGPTCVVGVRRNFENIFRTK